MSSCILRFGIVFVAMGLALLSPLADFVPLDFWAKLQGPLSGEAPSQQDYVRVVPAEESRIVEVALLGVGLVLVAAASYFRSRE